MIPNVWTIVLTGERQCQNHWLWLIILSRYGGAFLAGTSPGQSLESAVASDNRGNICLPQSRKNFSTEDEGRTTENHGAECKLRSARRAMNPYSVALRRPPASSVLKTLRTSHLHGCRDARTRVNRCDRTPTQFKRLSWD